MNLQTLTLVLITLVGAPRTVQELVPPEVGEVAPPIGEVRWLQVRDEDGGAPPRLAEQRGRVVVVHTYGHYCDP